MKLEKLYFYTAPNLHWQKLLKPDDFKVIIINSLKHLVSKNMIKVYGFVIMPNHIHFIWEMLEMNGKDLLYASFMKFTGHQFLKKLRINHPKVLPYFEVTTTTRTYQFWKREALPIEVCSRSVIEQKLNYIQ